MANGESKTEKKSGNKKYRNWVWLVYPKSAPDKWESKISKLCIPWCHSPLHDNDVNADGSKKDPHYHCLLMFDGPTTYQHVTQILKDIFGDPEVDKDHGFVRPFPCLSVRGTVRYFAHLDNPEKAQYDLDGSYYYICDIHDLMKPTVSESQKIIKDIQQFCIDNNILELCDLTDICMEMNEDWFYLLTTHFTLYFTSYLRSRRFKADRERKESEAAIADLKMKYDKHTEDALKQVEKENEDKPAGSLPAGT